MLSTHPTAFSAFVNDLQMFDCEIHIYREANTFGAAIGIDMDDAPRMAEGALNAMENNNVFFLAGVKPGIRARASDSDVHWRNMFTLDFDIRKELDKKFPNNEGVFIVQEGMTRMNKEEAFSFMANEILNQLDAHPTWQRYRYVVMSGNGMHVHYFGEPVAVVKDQWVAGMRDIFDEINTLTPIPCDTGCGNASRIMRMPGSWNVKGEKKPVEIIGWFATKSLPPLGFVQERGALAIARLAEKRAKERADFAAREDGGTCDAIDLINQIPIEQVVAQLFPGVRVAREKKDGGLRFCDEKKVERGFFKHKEFNIIVHEGTGLFAAPEGKGYNCLGLVRAVNGCSTREAIEWFSAKSAAVRAADAADREQWAADHAAKEIAFIDSLPPDIA